MYLATDKAIPGDLVLHVGDSQFSVAAPTNLAIWSNTGLSWSTGQKVSLRLTESSDGAGGDSGGADSVSVTGVSVTSGAGPDKTYALGETINVRVTFSETVDVTGTPRLKIDMDPAEWGEKWAAYKSGSGSTSLTFAHEVVEPNISTQGIAVLANTLELNSGTIRSGGADADLAHTGLAHDANHKVDWQLEPEEEGGGGGDDGGVVGLSGDSGPPSVTAVSVVSDPGDDKTYLLGDKIQVRATFSEAVTVTGTPGLKIDMDPAHWGEKRAAYESGSGTRHLTFSLTVVEPNYSSQGIAVLANTLALGGGTIRSSSGTNAALAHSGLGHDANHKVDWRPEISVADAQANEGAGSISFEVSLSRAFTTAGHSVTVDYATADGTATAGEDYTATSGTLTFAAGESSKTVSVAVLDDSHDEGDETFTLRLTNLAGARAGDMEATGTIVNTDPVPRGWLARFGRTVAETQVDAVRDRMGADRSPGVSARFAGRPVQDPAAEAQAGHRQAAGSDGTGVLSESLDMSPTATPASSAEVAVLALHAPGLPDPEAGRARPPDGFQEDGVLAFRSFLAGEEESAGDTGMQTLTEDDILLGTSFIMTRDTGTGSSRGFWGRAGRSWFSGRDGDTSVDGEATGVMLGTDWKRKDTLFGLIVSTTRGTGTYSGASSGEIDVTLKGLVPWAGREIGENLSAWGAVGIGRGDMTLTPEGADPIGTGIGWRMVAAGAEGALAPGERLLGASLNWRADALRTRTASDAATGLAATTGATTRLRLGLTVDWQRTQDSGATLGPRLEAALRHDGGDAETGFGMEIGGGFGFSDPASGLSVTVDGRTLALHEDGAFENWGLSLGLSWDPRPETRRGWSLAAKQSLGGASSGGVDALLGPEAFPGLTGAEDEGGWSLEAAYGTGRGNGMVGSPYGRASGTGGVDGLRLGYRIEPDAAHAADASLDLWAGRGTDGDGSEAGAGLEWRW